MKERKKPIPIYSLNILNIASLNKGKGYDDEDDDGEKKRMVTKTKEKNGQLKCDHYSTTLSTTICFKGRFHTNKSKKVTVVKSTAAGHKSLKVCSGSKHQGAAGAERQEVSSKYALSVCALASPCLCPPTLLQRCGEASHA